MTVQTIKAYGRRSCLHFVISYGLHFDDFLGTVPLEQGPFRITLSWHRNVNNSSQIRFGLTQYGSVDDGAVVGSGSLDDTTDLTQADGTLNVTFRGAGCVMTIFIMNTQSTFSNRRIHLVLAINQTSFDFTTRNTIAATPRFEVNNTTLSPSYVTL